MSDVDAIAQAITSHAWELAAESVIALWRHVRAPELAELMATLDLVVAWTTPPVPRFELEELRGLALLERGRLLTALQQGPEVLVGFEADSSEARQTLVALCELLRDLDPDPRVSATLLELEGTLPLRFEQYEDHGSLIDDCLDEREPLTALFCEACLHHWSPAMVTASTFSERVVQPEHPTEFTLDQRDRLFDALLELRATLFDDAADRVMSAAVVVDSSNVDAMRVYADWLISRGDPRGALIHDTLAGVASVRADFQIPDFQVAERAFGPMRRWADCDLVRGWASKVRFYFNRPAWSKPHAARLEIGWRPGWAGVEHLVDPPAELLSSTRFPALVRLECSATTLDEALANGVGFPRLTHLSLDLTRAGRDIRSLGQRLAHPGLPQLTSLRFARKERPRSLDAWLRQPGRVTELYVDSSADGVFWADATAWLSRLRGSKSPLRRVVVTSSAGERWVFEHCSEGVDWQAARLEFWGQFNVSVVDRIALVHSRGVEQLRLVTAQALAPNLVGELRRRVRDCSIEVEPELPPNDAWG